MRIFLKVLPVLLLIAAGGYYLSRDPRVRDLFVPVRPVQRHPLPPAAVPEAADASHAAPHKPAPRPDPVRPQPEKKTEPAPAAPGQAPPTGNTTENSVVARVLLQILFAKKLSSGVSLRVTDEIVEVTGEVDSPERRRAILEVIEGGREARRIEAKNLVVRK